MGINNFGENTQNNEKINVKYDFFINKKDLDYALEHLEEGAEPQEGNSSQFEIGEYSYTDLDGEIKKDTITVKMFLNKVYIELDGTYIFDDIDTQININGDNINEKIKYLLNKYIQKEVIKPQSKDRIQYLKKEVNKEINTKKQISETKKDISKIKSNLFETEKNDKEKNTPTVIIEKENKPKIKFSSEKYNNDFKIFKDYCEKNNLNTEEELHRIQQKEMDNVSKDELMYFGPKTINYLNSKIYKKEKLEIKDIKKQDKTKIKEEKIIPIITPEKALKNIELTNKKYKEEFDAFKKYCEENNLNPEEELYKIQKKMGVKEDDLMSFGGQTATYIYRNSPDIYVKYSYKQSVRDRAKIFKDSLSENKDFEINKVMNDFFQGLEGYNSKFKNYSNNGKNYKIYARWSAFKKQNLSLKGKFGNLLNSEPIEGTAIAKGLKNIASDPKLSGKSKSNNVYLFRNYNDKRFTLVYFQDGKVKLATYASPGNPKVRGGEKTQESKGKIGFGLDKNHISMSSNSNNIKLNKETKIGTAWSMPYSIPIPDINPNKPRGHYIHASTIVTGEPASHGCIRIPPFYSKIMYDYVKTYKPNIQVLEVK